MEFLEALKQFAISLLQSPILAESALRTFLILVPSIGAHVFLYVILKKVKPNKDNSILTDVIGYSFNIGLSLLMAAAYAEGKWWTDLMFWYKGTSYGLSTIAVHFGLVKYIEKKYKIKIP